MVVKMVKHIVHCHIGSLEKRINLRPSTAAVHYRTGSLEKRTGYVVCMSLVHYRTGSLEIIHSINKGL